jgi:predicted CXXCH cytochrome family protein
LPALLEPGLYHADGQIDGEVHEYGSFLQSRMHAFGVACSNCHDPHSAKLRAEGNALCAQCHLPEKFDLAAHHHHLPGSTGAQCVDCHMPTKNYMVVDARRDHSIRLPRPDWSVSSLLSRTGKLGLACCSDQRPRLSHIHL